MSQEKLSGLYWDQCQIGPVELDKITLMLLCFADDIWLNANMWPRGQDDESGKHVQARLEGLVEQKLIKLWTYPTKLQPPPPANSFAARFSRSLITEISPDLSKTMHEGIADALHKYARKMPRLASSISQERPEFEGIVEFVNLGSQLWSLSVANHLGASQILASSRALNTFEAQLSKYQHYTSIAEPAFRKFLSSHFPSGIGELEIKDIMRLRKYSEGIRAFVLGLLNLSPEVQSPTESDILARKIEQEYIRMLEEELLKNQPKRIAHLFAENAILTIVGFISPILQGLPWIIDLWRRQRELQKQRAPVYFMLELKKRARK